MRCTVIFCFTVILSTGSFFTQAQCGCDLILRDRTSGDGLQALNLAAMPDSTSNLFIHNDSSGWLELVSSYGSIIEGGAIKAGTEICLTRLERRLYLENVQGESWNPVIIKNYPGTVAEISSEPSYAGLQIHNSKYFEVRGDCGVPDSVYGISIHGVNSNGVEVSGKSEEFVITRVRVDTAGTGIKVKDNRDGYFANCTPASGMNAPTDSAWYASNITIESCYLANLINEGIYMNNTSYKYDYNCDTDRIYYGYEMDGVYLRDNLIVNAGKDGIQATGVVRNGVISGNRILNVGMEGSASQGNGIHFGEGSTGKVFNNWVEKTSGVGIFSAGIGAIDIYQNVVLQSGTDGIRAHAGTARCEGSCKYSNPPVFFGLNNYYDVERLSIFNNTVAYAGAIGINIDAPVSGVQMKKVYVNNNIVTEWTTESLDFISSRTANYDGFTHAGNNFIRKNISDAGFVSGTMNTAGNYGPGHATDVRLTSASGACDNGIGLLWTTDTPSEFIGGDFENHTREQQSRIDCGVYESNHTLPTSLGYQNTTFCECALPGQIYGFDGATLGAGYRICLLDSLRTGRIWFQNLEGTTTAPVRIAAIEELSIAVNDNSNAISFKNSSNIEIAGPVIHISASTPVYATVDFISGNFGNLLLSDLDIAGSDDLIDIAHGSGTNLFDTIVLRNVHLESTEAGKNLLRIKGKPRSVQLVNVKAVSGQLNQPLMEVNLNAGGDLGIYNSIFDGFDTNESLFKWIQLAMQPVGSSYEARSVKFINNTLVNMAGSNTSTTTSNFRVLHKSGTGFIDTLNFINNAIHKSAIQSGLTAANYKNSANQISVFAANYEVVSHNFSSQVYDSLHLDTDYLPEESANSPLLNSGTDLAYSFVRNVDFYGHIRPDSVYQQVDIGACELQPSEYVSGLSSAFSASSLQRIYEEPAMAVYPNPAADELRVIGLAEGDQVIMTNATGNPVFYRQVDASTVLLNIVVRNWKRGRYYLRVVQQEEDTLYKHVIVSH